MSDRRSSTDKGSTPANQDCEQKLHAAEVHARFARFALKAIALACACTWVPLLILFASPVGPASDAAGMWSYAIGTGNLLITLGGAFILARVLPDVGRLALPFVLSAAAIVNMLGLLELRHSAEKGMGVFTLSMLAALVCSTFHYNTTKVLRRRAQRALDSSGVDSLGRTNPSPLAIFSDESEHGRQNGQFRTPSFWRHPGHKAAHMGKDVYARMRKPPASALRAAIAEERSSPLFYAVVEGRELVLEGALTHDSVLQFLLQVNRSDVQVALSGEALIELPSKTREMLWRARDERSIPVDATPGAPLQPFHPTLKYVV